MMENCHLLDFVNESGGNPEVLVSLGNQLGYKTTSTDSLLEARALRTLLIGKGFEYNDRIFKAQDIAKLKQGNCLGYALLIGSTLLDNGFDVSFDVITHPKDAVHKQDQKLFEMLYAGDFFAYDKPVLPRLRDVPFSRAYRFAPLEHPSLLLNGRNFEVTSLEDLDEDPNWMPDSERKARVSFWELLSFVKIDTAQFLLEEEGDNLAEARDLVQYGLKLWNGNREGWLILWRIARDLGDTNLESLACSRYAEIGGDDSRYFQGMYEMTGNSDYLKMSLGRFPENILSFTSLRVELEKDEREAKFNLAVAAWCVANSSCLSLERFYQKHEGLIRKLYGDKVWRTLFS
jgi:hypothetical protein